MRARMDAIVAELDRAARVPRRGGDGGDPRVPRLGLGPPLHLPRLPRLRARDASSGEDQLRIVARSGLGVLREPKLGRPFARASPSCPRQLRALAREPRLLVLTKANARATVHRPGYLDYIGVKRFDAARAR